MAFQFPTDQQRLTIVGATGSGKTVAAMWQLSHRDFDRKPWMIYNFKHDELIDGINGAQHIGVDAPPPERPGIYVVHPHPAQTDAVDAQMWAIWEREDIGVYVDEGFMIGRNSTGFRALLTQGRSKHIPLITLSQRPVWMDRFVFTESEFLQVFRLQHRMDTKKMEEFIPNPNVDRAPPNNKHPLETRLPEYWSYYYDVGRDRLEKMRPTPDADAILDTIDLKLRRIRKVI